MVSLKKKIWTLQENKERQHAIKGPRELSFWIICDDRGEKGILWSVADRVRESIDWWLPLKPMDSLIIKRGLPMNKSAQTGDRNP